MRAWLCVLALAGCDQVFGIGDPYEDAQVSADTGGPDAPRADAMIDGAEPADATVDPIPALLASYSFDGTFNDASSAAVATPTGAGCTVRTTGGAFGGEAVVNGTCCITFPLAATPATFSIVFWVEEGASFTTSTPLLSRPHVAASTTRDWSFFGSESSIDLDLYNGQTETYSFNPGLTSSWQQYAITFDGMQVHLYSNGTSQGAITGSPVTYGTGATVYLGCDGAGVASGKFIGAFDEVRIYDGVLTGMQVNKLYLTGVLP